jgi:hypothetical protein
MALRPPTILAYLPLNGNTHMPIWQPLNSTVGASGHDPAIKRIALMAQYRQHPCVSRGSIDFLKYGGTLDILRIAEGLTYDELAKESGVDVKTVERACRGRGVVTLPHFLRILRVLRPNLVRHLIKLFPPEHFEQEFSA